MQQLQPGDGEFTPVASPAIAWGFPALLGAATSLYTYLQNRPLAVPGGDTAPDTAFLLFYRGFEGTQPDVRVTVGTLPSEQVNEFCPKTAEFEERLAEVASATPREGLTSQQWGTAVHLGLRRTIERQYDPRANVVSAEMSLVEGESRRYGTAGSTRLDIYHRIEGTSTICAYDVKTGQAELSARQAGQIYREAFKFAQRGGVINPRVLVIELRHTP